MFCSKIMDSIQRKNEKIILAELIGSVIASIGGVILMITVF